MNSNRSTGRKPLPASLRWQVFARDGFRCVYCGSQAGEPGVRLHADHVTSVADGGTNAIDNLVTACQRCNSGKGAMSLSIAPASAEAVGRASALAATLLDQADALSAAAEAAKDLEQEIINLLCEAYGTESVKVSDVHLAQLLCLNRRHGPETLAAWVFTTARRGIPVGQCVRYMHGIARNVALERGDGAA